MGEEELIKETKEPRTLKSLTKDLKELGIQPGMTLLTHSSLSSLGWVCGGAVTVIQALMKANNSGTIIMPTFSYEYSDPSQWENPPVPEDWENKIKANMPAYNPKVAPTRGVGKIPEIFRNWPGVKRSSHPTASFAAGGKFAKEIIKDHSLDYPLGENSPLSRLYDLNAKVLFLGTGFDTNTCFHLGEYRAPDYEEIEQGAPVLEEDERVVWKSFKDIELFSDKFEEIGQEFKANNHVKKGKVGSADAKLFSLKEAVDFSKEWFKEFRS